MAHSEEADRLFADVSAEPAGELSLNGIEETEGLPAVETSGQVTDENGAQWLTTDADKSKLPEVNLFIDSFLERAGCSMKAQMQIDLTVEEIFVNIASYSYGGGEGKASVGISLDGDEVTIVFVDSGIPYDPLKKPDPDTTLSAAKRQIGGLGIFLVKKTMDSVEYEYIDGKNVLTIKKKIR